MTVVVDTSIVLALYDADDRFHVAAASWLADVDDELVTTPLALAEIDRRLAPSAPARAAFYDDLERGAFTVRWWADALAETLRVASRRPDVGLAAASLVALAARLRTNRIATYDRVHLRDMTEPSGEPFVLLPADHT